MADIEMPESIPCQFSEAWTGMCGKPTTNGWCSEHEDRVCASCGQKAFRSCSYTNGSYACGASLCKTCGHSREDRDKHVTEGELKAEIERYKADESAKKASRTSPEQRMHPELKIPLNLFELLKADPKQFGFELGKVYFLELKHGLMAFFPAIFTADEKRIVFTHSLQVLERVWELLEPRRAGIVNRVAYINRTLGLAYIDFDTQEDRETSTPERLIVSADVISSLLQEQLTPFRWASGLFGDGSLSMESYMRMMADQAIQIDPSFVSTYRAA